MANRKLGKYEVTERLGRGGMAEVYRAYHATLDRFVAIKVLHAFLADDPEFKNRFEREARNIAKLKHPNIVQVYDFDYDAESESYYMVMELVEGLTLKDLLFKISEQGKLPSLKDALRYVREAASALAYAHSQSMVHRDVKPGNLMLDRDERVVLTDFGIAKIVTNQQFTATGGMVGTPAYMSPEQGLGEAGDERSDLYSLGVILFQLVTGRLPYDAETPLAVILKHLNEPIPSARAFRPELPEGVDRVIVKMMAKDPTSRYQSANDIISDLERLERIASGEERGTSTRSSEGAFDTLDLQLPKMSRPATPDAPAVPRRVVRKGHDDEPPTTPAPPPHRETVIATVEESTRRFPLWIPVLIVILLLLVGGYWFGSSQGLIPTVAIVTTPAATQPSAATEEVTAEATATDLPTETATPEATETRVVVAPTVRPSATPTRTPSPTSTHSPTPTNTDTATPTNTPTPTQTASRTPRPSMTPSPTITLTSTPDVTQTLIQATMVMEMQTATTAACDFDFEVVQQDPADGDFFPTDSDYVREITLRNTGTCAWERNSSLTFVSGESFNAETRIFVRDRVNVGDEYVLTFEGHTPVRGGELSGLWELRTPGQIPIGDPITISIFAFVQS